MPSTFNTFEEQLRVATAGLEPEAMRRKLANFARQSLAEAIASGKAPPNYERFVNNRPGVSEDMVQLPGPILYLFSSWRIVVETALSELRKRTAPGGSGRYNQSFLVVANNQVVTNYDAIPRDASVTIVNFQPYTRKMESGGNRSSRGEVDREKKPASGTGKQHFEHAANALRNRFRPAFTVSFSYFKVSAGLHPLMPYILKGQHAGLREARKANPERFSRAFHKRKDLAAGQPITYPALIIIPG